MAIDRDKIVDRVVSKMPDMGIQTKVDDDDSHTVKLVRAIVNEIINEIITNGEIALISVQTQGPGNLGAPVIGSLVPETGRGIIK